MSINSIEVRVHLNYKFNLRLSNFIINSSILNRYLRYFSISISNLLWIVVWRHQATPTYIAFSVIQHAVKSSPMDVVKSIFGENCSPYVQATGQGNHFEFIPMVSMESQHSTGGPICHDFPRFV